MKNCWQCGVARIGSEGNSDPPHSSTFHNETQREYKKCPFCAEWILKDAVKCRHCGEFLNNSQEGSQPDERHQNFRAGVDKTASELAIVRLGNEIAALEYEINRIEAPRRQRIKQHYSSGVFLAVCFVVMLFFGSIMGGPGDSVCGWYTAMLGITAFLSFVIGQIREKRPPKAEVLTLHAMIREKWSELKRHKEIVNS